MSFSGIRRSFDPIVRFLIDGGPTEAGFPGPSSSMSLRPVIPRRVGLHQSPPPLHQPRIILKEKTAV